MPGFDGTGPLGLGPMTGRGMGYCAVPLNGPGTGRASYGYAGLAGTPVRTPYRTPFAVSNTFEPYNTYSWGASPYSPFWRPGFGMRFGRGFDRRFGCGRGGFSIPAGRQGFGRGWGRGRGR